MYDLQSGQTCQDCRRVHRVAPRIRTSCPSSIKDTFVMMDLTSAEVLPGLVLHMAPSILDAEGAEFFPPDECRVEGDHFFLCVAVEAEHSYWVPLSSKVYPGRVLITGAQKFGQASWIGKKTYAVANRFCRAHFPAVIAACAAADDKTRKGDRNFVNRDALSHVQSTVGRAPF